MACLLACFGLYYTEQSTEYKHRPRWSSDRVKSCHRNDSDVLQIREFLGLGQVKRSDRRVSFPLFFLRTLRADFVSLRRINSLSLDRLSLSLTTAVQDRFPQCIAEGVGYSTCRSPLTVSLQGFLLALGVSVAVKVGDCLRLPIWIGILSAETSCFSAKRSSDPRSPADFSRDRD